MSSQYKPGDLVSIAINVFKPKAKAIGIIKFLYGQKPDKESFRNMVILVVGNHPDYSNCVDCVNSFINEGWEAIQKL